MASFVLPNRPAELHDRLNRKIYHPLARRLALALVGTFVTPNMLSVMGALFVVAATIAYIQPGWPLPAIIGLLLHMTWHIVDGADGDLARMTGTNSVRGELIDGICDYSSHIFLYLTLGTVMAREIGEVAWVILVLSGASHIIQVNHYEVQRRQYQWWVYGIPWMASTPADFHKRSIMGLVKSGYLALAGKLASQESEIDTAIAVNDHDNPARLESIRSVIRGEFEKPLKAATLLGANHRTITLGVSMLAGSPVFHMVYQIVVLNILLLRSISVQRLAVAKIVSSIAPVR
jgi:phosphatidylglycerophosphate synthase